LIVSGAFHPLIGYLLSVLRSLGFSFTTEDNGVRQVAGEMGRNLSHRSCYSKNLHSGEKSMISLRPVWTNVSYANQEKQPNLYIHIYVCKENIWLSEK